MNISLIGAGMGARRLLTLEAAEALGRADAVLGSERLLAGLTDDVRAERLPLAIPEHIADAVARHPQWRNVCVLLSGDVGFYSGARRLLALLDEHAPRLYPGISTPQYFAAAIRRPWQDFRLVSAHGVRCDVLAEVLNHPAVLFLTGGEITPAGIAAELRDAGLGGAVLTVGENLSAPDERIVVGTAAELAEGRRFAPLAAVLVDNARTFADDAGAAGIPDARFIRGATPMTKREVRAVALALLRVGNGDTVYDIGAGTGSVAVEAALQARRGRVYAVERDAAARALVKENREKFGAYNMRVVAGTAPEALAPLPPPDAVFIGGSGGRLGDIVPAVLGKNPGVRLVAAAISLETLSAAMAALRGASVADVHVTQVAATRAVARGGHHLLEAGNPVFLIGGGGR